jgi:hypothetical protein
MWLYRWIDQDLEIWAWKSIVMNAWNTVFEARYTDPDYYKYSIVPSVATNDLTVALKNYLWNDPSTSAPVKVQIWWVIRTITSALSVTKLDWTNWCNVWSTELATKEIDYFTYLGYNTTDWVVIWFSRIPYATTYADFSATTNNEKYAWISTITNATWTDTYVNIWRFSAILSAWTWFTWSLWTWTTISYPIFESEYRALNWSSTWAILSWFDVYKYKVRWNEVTVNISASSKSVSWSWVMSLVMPFVIASWSSVWTCRINDWTQWLLPLTWSNQIFKTINAWNWAWSETWVTVQGQITYQIA